VRMILLDGKSTAQSVRDEIKDAVPALVERAGRPPCLAVIIVGEDPASQVYVRNKEKACAEVGFRSEAYRLGAETRGSSINNLIFELNGRDDVDGILLQLPLPRSLDSSTCLACIAPDKDVDGFHPVNMGRLALGLPGFVPCTPAGVIELLRRYKLPTAGKKAVVLGRSNIVGRPLSLLLGMRGEYGDATVTLCHTKTPDVAEETRRADFLFAAVGRPGYVTADMVKEGAVVVDVGINRTDAGLVGDVDFDAVREVAGHITPVPGGVGPLTITMLLKNTLTAARLQRG
jgi:methylenetetrahydrofolate dehydrogenase (NADP+) / methenyltetrahydrofolate cyclohydrolase